MYIFVQRLNPKRQSFDLPRGNPKHPRRRDGINSTSLPPGDFVSGAMVVPVMRSAQWYSEFVADFASHRTELGEPQISRRPDTAGMQRTSGAICRGVAAR